MVGAHRGDNSVANPTMMAAIAAELAPAVTAVNPRQGSTKAQTDQAVLQWVTGTEGRAPAFRMPWTP